MYGRYKVLSIDPEIRSRGNIQIQSGKATDGSKDGPNLVEYNFQCLAGTIDPDDIISGTWDLQNPEVIEDIMVEFGRNARLSQSLTEPVQPAAPQKIQPPISELDASLDPLSENFALVNLYDVAQVLRNLAVAQKATDAMLRSHLGVCPTSREKSSSFGGGFSKQ